jgi:hypothetical protein
LGLGVRQTDRQKSVHICNVQPRALGLGLGLGLELGLGLGLRLGLELGLVGRGAHASPSPPPTWPVRCMCFFFFGLFVSLSNVSLPVSRPACVCLLSLIKTTRRFVFRFSPSTLSANRVRRMTRIITASGRAASMKADWRRYGFHMWGLGCRV